MHFKRFMFHLEVTTATTFWRLTAMKSPIWPGWLPFSPFLSNYHDSPPLSFSFGYVLPANKCCCFISHPFLKNHLSSFRSLPFKAPNSAKEKVYCTGMYTHAVHSAVWYDVTVANGNATCYCPGVKSLYVHVLYQRLQCNTSFSPPSCVDGNSC